MFFNIKHVTKYKFSQPVFLEPHTFRFIPRSDNRQTLLKYDIALDPNPAGLSSGVGAFDNREQIARFNEPTDYLHANLSLEVETKKTNPFDFIITESWGYGLPTSMPDLQRAALSPFLETSILTSTVRDYAEDILKDAGRETMPFLDLLNRSFRERFEYAVREEGEPHPPVELLARGKGSCRDFALLFMAVCRLQGLPARFVSGYHEGDPDIEQSDLHAWVDVYLPGGGWRGYDPTLGLLVDEQHVAVAAGPSNLDAAPITGSYRGDGVTSAMQSSISIQTAAT